MKGGFEVYRALSPSSSCDLLIKNRGKVFSIEVRLGHRTIENTMYYNKANVRADYVVVIIYNETDSN